VDRGTPDQRDDLEQRIAESLSAADWNAATTLVLEGYGQEVAAFLCALNGVENGDEVFSLFAEAVWRSAPAFERRCSARTWAYAIARRVSQQHKRTTRRRRKRFEPFAEIPELAQTEARVRTQTLSFLRTSARDKLMVLRDQLPAEDQVLLMLRVDRKLAWEDLAVVLKNESMTEAALKREAARLRKRFQLLKDKLRASARAAGLLVDRAPP
jgi:RNA polymerase sigma-70 factor (ECF subfamily)